MDWTVLVLSTGVVWNFNILRLLIAMMKERATGSCSNCRTYGTLFVINSLKMAHWCRNMLQLVPNMKCVL